MPQNEAFFCWSTDFINNSFFFVEKISGKQKNGYAAIIDYP